ncbi:MAG: cytochrome c peroxidase [Vicinamibacterales bacterium]
MRTLGRAATGRLAVLLTGTAVVLGLAAMPRAQPASPFAPLPLQVDSPPDNPSTPEKIALGRLLFWDPILSGDQDIACATCHHPVHGYADGRDLPIGAGGKGMGPGRIFPGGINPLVKRNSPTILNVAFNGIDTTGHVNPGEAPMFWDSRTRGLEAQALVPIESLEEMRGGKDHRGDGVAGAVARLRRVRRYQELFRGAFGGPEPITAVNLSRAIAAFERSLVTSDAPFDRYLRGDQLALSVPALRGMTAFIEHGCTLCHNGPMLSDYQLHVIGVSDNAKLGAADPGAEGRFAFRTPSLRNLAFTAPYMHSGLIKDLGSAVGFYKEVGGGAPGLVHFEQPRLIEGRRVLGSPVSRDKLDPLLRQVSVTNELNELVAFLGALNGTFDRSVPARVPSGLRVGGK